MKKFNQFAIGLGICALVFILAVLINRCANEFSSKIPYENDSLHTERADRHRDTSDMYLQRAEAQIKALDSLKNNPFLYDSLIEFDKRERTRIRRELGFPD